MAFQVLSGTPQLKEGMGLQLTFLTGVSHSDIFTCFGYHSDTLPFPLLLHEHLRYLILHDKFCSGGNSKS